MSDGQDPAAPRWQPWAPADLRTPAEPPAEAADDLAEEDAFDPAAFERDIGRLRAAAQARGHAEGYAAGHEQGREAGHRDGYAQGHEEGHRAGHQQALADGTAQLQAEAARLAGLADACAQSIEHIDQAVGDALVDLAIRLARKVVGDALSVQRDHLIALVSDLLHQDGDPAKRLTVRIHPDDEALLRSYLNEHEPQRRWRLMPDPTITAGGCLIDTAHGRIDARIETRWQRSVSALGRDDPWQPEA